MHKLTIFVSAAILATQASAVSVWGQCGGQGYSGSTACDDGSTCVKVSDWYSQCQPGGSPVTTEPPVATATPEPPVITQPPSTPTAVPADPPSSTSFVPPSASPSGLTARFYAKGKKFWGTCADPGTLGKTGNVNVIKSDFGQVTPENSMKWDATEPQRGTFNFGNADQLVNWAVSNGKLIRGHTLVWHSQLPGWVSSVNNKDTLTSVINNHITNVAGRFKGKLYAWDVVNECLTEQGGLRDSVFSRVLGESFVSIAFTTARSVDPSAVLYINDYNLDSNNAKTQGMVALIKRVNANSQLIDGVGTQMHLEANGAGGALAALQALASAPVKEVAITELDIKNASANDYTNVLKACLQVEKCQAITSWGVADPDSWRASNNPLLFDGQYRPKAAYNALIQALA